MPLNLDDNKRPYFKQLNLDETFDEIQNYVNNLESDIPSPSSDVTVNQLVTTATASVGSLIISNTASIATSVEATDSVLTINNSTGKVNKKANLYKEVILSAAQLKSLLTSPITLLPALSTGQYYKSVNVIFEYYAGSVAIDISNELVIYWLPDYMTFGTISRSIFNGKTNTNLVCEMNANFGYYSFVTDAPAAYQDATSGGALVLQDYVRDASTGNGTAKIKINYQVGTIG